MKKIIFLFMIFSLNLYSQTNLDYEFKNPFRVYETDRYYMGWQDPRAFIGRLLFAKNFNVEKNLTKISPEANWDFKSVSLYVEGKVASEIMFYRNKYFSVGMGAGMEISILGRKNGLFDVYHFSGQFDLFLDLWLQNLTGINLKIRFIPMYHQSTHLVDGFKGDVHIRSGSSYEFAAISVYYYINNFTIYGGWEFSYNTVGNSPQIFRLHTGFDYRLPLYKEINFITGINSAVILDEKDNLGLIVKRENLHAAINLAAGIEFYRFAIALKFGYGKPRGASSYFGYESKIGAEISLLF
ncbi:hypothetical protein EPJ74_05580 [Brachyspira aalborgi]|uniref:Toxin A n=1 Tax=Brachyspira aalborgi TaxID=29522 RepID=A0A5C8GHK5_9SPIR|nr:hypothetical protein [Brachyspira aalborgi]TXJ60678.1 hypothetical protein EPJ74_05580 [Brachyspira aalborgi]